MRLVASLLLAVLVPAALLPAGASLCMYSLLGLEMPPTCCAGCCGHRAPPGAPAIGSRECRDCMYTAAPQAAAPAVEKRTNPDVVPDPGVPPCVPPAAAPLLPTMTPPRIAAFLRDELRRPPPLVERARPLRL